MWIAAIAVLCFSMLLLIIRAIMGPTVFDRLLAANVFGTNIVILIAILAFVEDTKDYLDVALVYAFLNFIATVGFLRFFKYGSFRKGKRISQRLDS